MVTWKIPKFPVALLTGSLTWTTARAFLLCLRWLPSHLRFVVLFLITSETFPLRTSLWNEGGRRILLPHTHGKRPQSSSTRIHSCRKQDGWAPLLVLSPTSSGFPGQIELIQRAANCSQHFDYLVYMALNKQPINFFLLGVTLNICVSQTLENRFCAEYLSSFAGWRLRYGVNYLLSVWLLRSPELEHLEIIDVQGKQM